MFHVIVGVEGGVCNLGDCPIISALPMMRTRQPAQSEGVLYFSSWFNDPQGGIARLLPADATLPGSGEPPSVWNDDGSTKIMDSWHGGVIRVAEKEGWTLSSRVGGVGLATLCGGTASALSPFTAGFRALARTAQYNVLQGQADVREANSPMR